MSSNRLGSPPFRAPILTEQARAIPSVSVPSSKALAVTTQSSETYSFFTKAGPEQQLYSGDRSWAQVTLELQTAGPVAIAMKQNFTPVASGKGTLLTQGEPRAFICAKGSRIWIAATAANRVAVTVEPLPWLEQIYAANLDSATTMRQLSEILVRLLGAKK